MWKSKKRSDVICNLCWKTFFWDFRAKHCPECNSKLRSENMSKMRKAFTKEQEEKRLASWHKRYDWLSEEDKKEINKKQVNSNKKRYKESWKIKRTVKWKYYYRDWKIKFSWYHKYTRDISYVLKSNVCKYCWKWYYSRHMWKAFCSKGCYEKYRTEIWWIWIHKCKMCWKEFRPKRAINSTYCSVQCANRDREINHKVLSDINISRWEWLKTIWYTPFYEYPLWNLSYDIQIGENILIEVNTSAFHSSTYSPYWDKYIKEKMYHYNKTHYAIDNGYKCINIRDWTTKEEVKQMIEREFIYEWEPRLYWCNRKTGELYNDKVNNKYTVWIYDSWKVKFI